MSPAYISFKELEKQSGVTEEAQPIIPEDNKTYIGFSDLAKQTNMLDRVIPQSSTPQATPQVQPSFDISTSDTPNVLDQTQSAFSEDKLKAIKEERWKTNPSGVILQNIQSDIGDLSSGLGNIAMQVPTQLYQGAKEIFTDKETGKPTLNLSKSRGWSAKSLKEGSQQAVDIGKAIVDSTVEDYKRLLDDPKNEMIDHPFNTLLNVAGAMGAAKAVLGGASKLAKIGNEASKVSKVLGAGEKALNAKTYINLVGKGMEKAFPEVAESHRIAKTIDNLTSGMQSKAFYQRNKDLERVRKYVDKLSDTEKIAFNKAVEGYAEVLPKPGTSIAQQGNLARAVRFYKHLNSSEQSTLKSLGYLTADQIEERAFKPLAIAFNKSTTELKSLGIQPTYLPHLFEDLSRSKTMRGIYRKFDEFEPDLQNKIDNFILTGEGEELLTNPAKQFISDLGGLKENEKTFIKVVGLKNQGPKNVNTSDFFTSQPVKAAKVPFIKKFTKGREGWIQDPVQSLNYHRAQYRKLIDTRNIIDTVVGQSGELGIKPYKAGDHLPVGYKIWAPEGFLRFYRGKYSVQDELFRAIERNQQAKAKAAGEFIPQEELDSIADDFIRKISGEVNLDELEKTYMGVAKNVKAYAVPDEVADRVNSNFQTLFGQYDNAIKLFYDKPTDFFKFNVLMLRPAYIRNQLLGNAVFGAMAGISPASYLRALQKKYINLVPKDTAIGLTKSETYFAKMGKVANSPLMAAMGKIADFRPIRLTAELIGLGAKPLYKIGVATRNLVGKIDNYFRSAGWLDKASQIAQREGFYKKAGLFAKSDEVARALIEVKHNNQFAAEAMKHVNDFFGDYITSSRIERQLIKRIFPFERFYKHSIKLLARYPINHPIRALLMKNVTMVANEETKDLPDFLKNTIAVSDDGKKQVRTFTAGASPFNIPILTDEPVLTAVNPYISSFGGEEIYKKTSLGADIKEPGSDYFGKTFDPYKQEKTRGAFNIENAAANLVRTAIPQVDILEKILGQGKLEERGPLFKREPIRNSKGKITYPKVPGYDWMKIIGINTIEIDKQKLEKEVQMNRKKGINKAYTELLKQKRIKSEEK